MFTLGVILARAGSTGLKDKNVLPLCGRPVVAYTLGHALTSELLDAIVLTTDSPKAGECARSMGVVVVDRPPHLAGHTVRIDDVVRHATLAYETTANRRVDAVVILYGNIPVRADDAIDRCVELLEKSRCDSVRTVAPVGKLHPDWMHRLDGDRMVQIRQNSIHRRQELDPLYYHDGSVVAVQRHALFAAEHEDDPHAFFGLDRRAVVQDENDTVDIDNLADFYRAEALIRMRSEMTLTLAPRCARRRPAFTAAVNHREYV
jgi:CMP-N-acetylneuraminic acid synthetase